MEETTSTSGRLGRNAVTGEPRTPAQQRAIDRLRAVRNGELGASRREVQELDRLISSRRLRCGRVS